jgi:hypothetical protein
VRQDVGRLPVPVLGQAVPSSDRAIINMRCGEAMPASMWTQAWSYIKIMSLNSVEITPAGSVRARSHAASGSRFCILFLRLILACTTSESNTLACRVHTARLILPVPQGRSRAYHRVRGPALILRLQRHGCWRRAVSRRAIDGARAPKRPPVATPGPQMDDQAPDRPSEGRGQQGPKGSLLEAEAQRRIGVGLFCFYRKSNLHQGKSRCGNVCERDRF